MPWMQLKNGRVAHRVTVNSGFMTGLVSADCGAIYAHSDMKAAPKKRRACKKCLSRR